jgi:predicted ABC-type transport system involved in lysophospholipase L1 biosynthesis ATPase subunit
MHEVTQPAVKATDVTRRYGEDGTAVDALRGVSLELEPGSLTAIMGPSGSGKSTLMHILAGLDRPTAGTVSLAGTEITGLGDNELTKLRRDHIGFVFQFFNLLPMLTAEENILLPQRIARRQVRRMIRQESVITALIGAGLGLPLGIFLAAVFTQALSDSGIGFSLPIGSLIAFTIVAIFAGIVAAVLPARRAARLDILKALHYE